jgi:hypothetical protein
MKRLSSIASHRLLFHLSATKSPTRTWGSTHFVRRRHQQSEQHNPLNSIYSPKELDDLAQKNTPRTPGSLKYKQTWRHWSTLALDSIRYHLAQNLPHPVDEDAFKSLSFNLGVGADRGEMPSFGDAGSRSGYALTFFCRARLLADLLVDSMDNPNIPDSWKDIMLEQRLLQGIAGEKTNCNITSLGGGPGFDFVAAALVATHNSAGSGAVSAQVAVFDYEEGWNDLVTSMNSATQTALQQPSVSCRWGGRCDITKPLSHPDNQDCLDAVPTTNLFTSQYCVSENAKQLRETNYVFFRDLFHAAPEGSLFLFTETTSRLWADFYDLVDQDCPFMEIGFPRNVGRGKEGPHLALCKRRANDASSARSIRPSDLKLVEEFRQLSNYQQRKIDMGWERQTKKIRGLK